MRQETFTLSQKELQRVEVISQCVQGNLACARAAELLDLSPRHIKRLKARYRQGSAAALAHASRGRPSPRRLPQRVRDRILQLARTRYAGFNDHHLCEKLIEQEGFSLESRNPAPFAARRAGIGSPRKRRAPAHRQRRPRVAREGRDRPARRLPARLARRPRPAPHRPGHAGRRLRQNPGRPVLSFGNRRRLLPPAPEPARIASVCPPPSTAIAAASSFATTITGPSKKNSPASANPLNSAAPWLNWASPSSPRSLPKPKAASNVSGACCKIASPANSAWPRLATSHSANAVLRRFIGRLQPPLRSHSARGRQSLAARSRRSPTHLCVPPRTHRQQRQRRAMGRPPLPDPAAEPALQLCGSQSPALPNSRWPGFALLRRYPSGTYQSPGGVTFLCCYNIDALGSVRWRYSTIGLMSVISSTLAPDEDLLDSDGNQSHTQIPFVTERTQ